MAKPDTTDAKGNVEQLRPWQRMQKELSNIAKLESENGGNFDIAAAAIDRILEADDLDSILSAAEEGPIKAEDMVNKPIHLHGVKYRKSEDKFASGGFGTYVVLEFTHAMTGEEGVFTCGAPNVVSQVRRMELLDLFNKPEKPFVCLRSRAVPNGELLYFGKP